MPCNLRCWSSVQALKDYQGCAERNFVALEEGQRPLIRTPRALPQRCGGAPVTSDLQDMGRRRSRQCIAAVASAPEPDRHITRAQGIVVLQRQLQAYHGLCSAAT